jgi:hypothetical protein
METLVSHIHHISTSTLVILEEVITSSVRINPLVAPALLKSAASSPDWNIFHLIALSLLLGKAKHRYKCERILESGVHNGKFTVRLCQSFRLHIQIFHSRLTFCIAVLQALYTLGGETRRANTNTGSTYREDDIAPIGNMISEPEQVIAQMTMNVFGAAVQAQAEVSCLHMCTCLFPFDPIWPNLCLLS